MLFVAHFFFFFFASGTSSSSTIQPKMQFVRVSPIVREIVQSRRFSSVTSDFKHVGIVGLVCNLHRLFSLFY